MRTSLNNITSKKLLNKQRKKLLNSHSPLYRLNLILRLSILLQITPPVMMIMTMIMTMMTVIHITKALLTILQQLFKDCPKNRMKVMPKFKTMVIVKIIPIIRTRILIFKIIQTQQKIPH